MAKITEQVAVGQVTEGGPGVPPYPWEVSGNEISYDGGVLVPASVTGGSMGSGTINAEAIFINGKALGGEAQIIISDTVPTSPPPVQGNLWFDSIGGQLYIYYNDGTTAQWVLAVNLSACAAIALGDTPPSSPFPGNLWFDTVKGQLYLYYNDGTSSQWVVAVNQGGAYLPTTGGSMTGALFLAADPTTSLGAATKHYVDSNIVNYLPLTGGTMTGSLILAADPTVTLGAATKEYVDGKIGSYLPLTGGTLTSGLTLAPTAANPIITLNKASTYANNIFGQQASLNRWVLQLGNGVVESGSNAGSNLVISGYQDNGTTSFTTLSCPRSTNVVTFTNAIVNGSDIRLKENVTPIQNALEAVMNIDGVSFNRKGREKREIGFIAQDIVHIIPEIVHESQISVSQAGGDSSDTSNILGIQYGQITALLVEAIKELVGRVELLEEK